MADYHNRYFTTEHFKQMNMLPDSMALIGVGEMEKPLSITMHDAMGISVSSHKTIVLRAGKGISISGKNVVFKTQRELRVIQGLGGTAKIEICNKIDVDAPKTNVKMTYHSATGRPQEKPSPDEDALAKVLMFVMGAAMITCVTATADLGPAGLMFGAIAGRVLPRITTGSGQIMMVTGAAVPALIAEALKRLAEMLAALKNKLLGRNQYWPYSIFNGGSQSNQFVYQASGRLANELVEIADVQVPLADGTEEKTVDEQVHIIFNSDITDGYALNLTTALNLNGELGSIVRRLNLKEISDLAAFEREHNYNCPYMNEVKGEVFHRSALEFSTERTSNQSRQNENEKKLKQLSWQLRVVEQYTKTLYKLDSVPVNTFNYSALSNDMTHWEQMEVMRKNQIG